MQPYTENSVCYLIDCIPWPSRLTDAYILSTQTIQLDHGKGMFRKGEIDEFHKSLPALGNIFEAQVKIDPEGGAGTIDDLSEQSDRGWGLEYIRVTELRTGTSWHFDCLQTIVPDGKFFVMHECEVQTGKAETVHDLAPVKYQITTTTSDIKGGGTDANVSITLFGSLNDSTGKRLLRKSKTHLDKFEKGHRDVFEIEALDLGQIKKVRIEHDGKGIKNSDWHLESVTVENMSTNEKTDFPCGQWISKRRGDKLLFKELFPDIS
eukprot:m.25236 g.25236  ORF g.25236 m.25236 type:complete len:264 (+) comp13152_c0_seq1:61-852(+)